MDSLCFYILHQLSLIDTASRSSELFLKVDYFSDCHIPVNALSSTELPMPETLGVILNDFPPLHFTFDKSPRPIKSASKNIYYISSVVCIFLISALLLGLFFYHLCLMVLLATVRNVNSILLQSKLVNKYLWKKRRLKHVAR